MAKIIKQGTAPAKRKYRLVCNECESIIEFTRLEGTLIHDKENGDYLRFECPVCENMDGLTHSLTPPNGPPGMLNE